MSESINVFCAVTVKNGERVPVSLTVTDTATQIRQKVSEATKIPLDQLRLIFRGKMIKDEDSTSAIAAYKLEQDCVLHCMGKPSASSTSSPSSASATTATDMETSNPTSASTMAAATAAVPSIAPAAAAAASAVAATISVDPLKNALQMLRASNSAQVYETAIATLAKILSNIADHPMEDKYRKVKKENVAFQKRLGGLNGGDAAMKAVGFVVEVQEGVPFYQLHASVEAWPKLMASKATVDAAAAEAKSALNIPPLGAPATNLFGGMGAPVANPSMGAVGGLGGLGGGMGGLGGMGGDANAMRAAMTSMMSNPEALRNMLQNPMVQQMMQNDPSVPPHLRSSMQQLANNPAMLNQLSTMMSNPATRARMEAMMGAGGMPGMMGSGDMSGMMGGGSGASMPGMMPPFQGQPNSNSTINSAGSPGSNGGNDQDQTEDEMIAEAIRRSLEES